MKKKAKRSTPKKSRLSRKGRSFSLTSDVHLGTNEERLRRMATVIQDSNDAITIQDLDGKILAWNRGAERIYGYSETEALQKNIVDTVPESHQLEAMNFIAALNSGELVSSVETKRKTKSGQIIDVWLTNTKLVDDQGKLTGVATTGRDITHRKLNEASLIEKARELEFLREGQLTLSDKMRGEQDIGCLGQSVLSHLAPFLNAQMGAFYCFTKDNQLQRVSGYAYSKIDDNDRTFAIGEGIIGQAALEKHPICLENIPANYYGKIYSGLGGATPPFLLFAPVFYEGKVNGVIELASFSSFSGHKRTFLEHVSENIGIAINTSISRKKLQELLERSQILSEKLQVQQEELQTANKELEQQSFALNMSQTRLESQQAELEHTNGQLELQTEALKQQRDILNEKNEALIKTQTLLEVRSDEVQRASQYKSEFLANMSHEIRTPLGAMLGYADLLRDPHLTENKRLYYLDILSRSGENLSVIINDILDLSKIESGHLKLELIDTNPEQIAKDVVSLLNKNAKDKGLILEYSSESTTAKRIVSDPTRIRQVLLNLIGNAIKFTLSGFVKIKSYGCKTGSGTNATCFEISDTGIGVPQEETESIFEIFSQADETMTRRFGGTGLGLALSRKLARSLGGDICVLKTALGNGSTFLFIFEDVLSAETLETTPSTSDIETFAKPQVNALKGITALLADDSPDNRYLIEHYLTKYGAVVESVEDGKIAIQRALSKSYDVILMDIQMPGVDGYAATIELRKSGYNKPIIALTAHAMSEVRQKCQAAGCTAYLTKPINFNELIAVIGETLLEAKDVSPTFSKQH